MKRKAMRARPRAQAAPARAEGTVKLDLFGPVGELGGIEASKVSAALDEAGDGELQIRLNTDGGIVTEGYAIYNLLKQAKAKVTIDVIGGAMSIGAYFLLAADKVRIAKNGIVMIHEPWGGVQGRAEDFDRQAAVLRQMAEEFVRAMNEKTKQEPDAIRAMLKAETYLTADEAVAMGLADEVIADAPKAALAMFKGAKFKGAPTAFLAAVAAATEEKTPMDLEQLLAAIAKLSDEEKAKVVAMLTEGDDAEEDAPPEEDPAAKAAVEALAAIRKLLGGDAAPAGDAAAVATAVATRLQSLEGRADAADFESLIVANAKKLSPAFAKNLRSLFVAKTISLAAARGMVEGLPEIADTKGPKAPVNPSAGGVLLYQGKAWKDLTGPQMAALHAEDPNLYIAMRDASK